MEARVEVLAQHRRDERSTRTATKELREETRVVRAGVGDTRFPGRKGTASFCCAVHTE